jgi:ssDNA-binding Zn-finger/Zn-ribbon topoisomerase 1
MAKSIYKGYLKTDKKIKTVLIEADSDREAMLLACKYLAVEAHLIELVKEAFLTCPKCSYSWSFKGFRKLYATCPQCMKQVLIADAKPAK